MGDEPLTIHRQRDNTDRSGKNTKSGAGVQPFRGDEASLKKRGVPNVPPAGFVSPEENTYEGTAQGGANTHLSPVPNAEQEGALLELIC